MGRCSTSYFIREFHCKVPRYLYTPPRMAQTQNTDSTKYWRGRAAMGTFVHSWWESKMVQLLWKTVSSPTKPTLTWPSNCSLWYYPKKLKTYVHTKTCVWMFIRSNFIHNCQNQDALQQVNAYTNRGTSTQRNITQWHKEMRHQAMKRHGGKLKAHR